MSEDQQEAETADPEAMVARAASRVPVQWVEAGYKMRDEYAFTYAFRKNTTKLTSISRHNGTLNAKMHDWYGDERGFTENYCKTFYECAIDDKDYTDMIRTILGKISFHHVIVTQVGGYRKVPAEKLAEIFREKGCPTAEACEDVEEAFKKALAAKGEDGMLFCVGSLYLVGEIKTLILQGVGK